MVALPFNPNQYTPQYGGSAGLPAGPNGENVRYKVVIVNDSLENVEKNNQIVGGYLALDLTPVEGPLAGTKHTDRLNLQHINPKTVEIANKQLAAYCHVVGYFGQNGHFETSMLHNKPFIVEIGLQKAPNPNGYTEVKALFDVNGNEPGKAGSGAPAGQPSAPPPSAPPAGVQAQGQGWGPPADQQQPQGNAGWGPPQGQEQQPQQQPQQNWGPQGGAPAGQPQGGGWPQQGAPSGQPGWGPR